MENQNPNVETQYRTMTVLWLALLNAQLMLPVVLFFAKREIFNFDFAKPPLGENPAIIIAFAVLGIAAFLSSFVLRKRLVRKAISERKTSLVQTALIIACALCEATTLFGFVSAFAFNYQFFIFWFAFVILGVILHFPKRDDLIAASYSK